MAANLKTYLMRPTAVLPEQIDVEEAAIEVIRLHNLNGGATFSLFFGDQAGQSLYSVSVFPDRSRIISGSNLSVEALSTFIRANTALLSDPRCCIGTWFSAETGRAYLDVSAVAPNKKRAVTRQSL